MANPARDDRLRASKEPTSTTKTMATKKSLNTGNKEFGTEACLVERFIGVLQAGRTTFGSVQVATEWDHRSGFVDVLARDGAQSLVAFEAKLADWRRAFMQAYRNTAYANRTYVLLPEKTVHRALPAREEFEFRGIGLCAFDGKKVRIVIEASEHDPLLSWVRARAHEHFDGLVNERPSRTRPAGGSRRPVQAARV
jgi:hypothetical protein